MATSLSTAKSLFFGSSVGILEFPIQFCAVLLRITAMRTKALDATGSPAVQLTAGLTRDSILMTLMLFPPWLNLMPMSMPFHIFFIMPLEKSLERENPSSLAIPCQKKIGNNGLVTALCTTTLPDYGQLHALGGCTVCEKKLVFVF